jgi:protein-S-isoprenylcysteine O-methyltransferase Ste14
MGAKNVLVLIVFLGLLAGVFLIAIAFDVWVQLHWGDGATISWSVALLAIRHPFLVNAFVLDFGVVSGGLLVHFLAFRQPDPRDPTG